MVSHANLIANAGCIKEGFQHPKGVWGVTWLPPYHDMGLIGGILQPIYFDAPSAVISPLDFVRRPIIWLEAVTRYRARITGGPNFAYELCARTVTPAEMPDSRSGLLETRLHRGRAGARGDTGAVRRPSLQASVSGKNLFSPVMAWPKRPSTFRAGVQASAISRRQPLREHRVLDKSENDHDNDTRAIVGCGRPASVVEGVNRQPEHRACRVQRVRSARSGSPARQSRKVTGTDPTILEPLFKRGSLEIMTSLICEPEILGFIRNGELFITGRSKDLIIIRGRNHYPQDIEHTVARVSQAVRPGSCAAFSVDSGSEEKLVLIVEMPRPRPEKIDVFTGDIRQAVAAAHEVQPSVIVLVRPGAIPITSSGKVRRLECREQYISGAFSGLTV